MHLKVFLKLKKPYKLSLLGKYKKKTKKQKKNKKQKITHWAGFFFLLLKPSFFPTLGAGPPEGRLQVPPGVGGAGRLPVAAAPGHPADQAGLRIRFWIRMDPH
jgi:hypothetical protein